MSNGGRADGPLVLWPFGLNGGLTGGRERERDGGFKYFDYDHVYAPTKQQQMQRPTKKDKLEDHISITSAFK